MTEVSLIDSALHLSFKGFRGLETPFKLSVAITFLLFS
ncbi:hypothetical protein HS7_02400 [Sulfolobales archaeon HS-7]|nr:hypothetical protein HS7_02400 [Sulfolobales archaeon HS-7]